MEGKDSADEKRTVAYRAFDRYFAACDLSSDKGKRK
jgi:hypothetical protein